MLRFNPAPPEDTSSSGDCNAQAAGSGSRQQPAAFSSSSSSSQPQHATISGASLIEQATAAYHYSLERHLYSQAVWYAERLLGERPESAGFRYLLGLAYYHSGETAQAYYHLRKAVHNSPSPTDESTAGRARYLLAKCCHDLGKWEEAEAFLIFATATATTGNIIAGATGGGPEGTGLGAVNTNGGSSSSSSSSSSLPSFPKAAKWIDPAVWFLLGQVQERQGKTERATNSYGKCVEEAPWMFEAVTRLAHLTSGARSTAVAGSSATSSPTAFVTTFGNAMRDVRTDRSVLFSGGDVATATSLRDFKVVDDSKLEASLQRAISNSNCYSAFRPAEQEGASRAATEKFCDESTLSCPSASKSKPSSSSTTSLWALLYAFGCACHATFEFDQPRAQQFLDALPANHFQTPYCLDLLARAFFEQSDYRKAESLYQRIRGLEPRRVEGLERYSTCLWHLRKELECAYLAHECLAWGVRRKPEVWCVVGNACSQQKEHDLAIKFFQRAILADPFFSYAYTLCGHEYVANEKFDKAVPLYEKALAIDGRHYNAWWGLGNVYFRQEEYDAARYHFLKALEINGGNSVLRCYLGMVMEALHQPALALEYFERACGSGNADTASSSSLHLGAAHQQNNVMALFQKACVLMSLQRHGEALRDLERVRNLAPKEACVYFQLGKVYEKMGLVRKAFEALHTALNLHKDSKDYHTIKAHLERLPPLEDN